MKMSCDLRLEECEKQAMADIIKDLRNDKKLMSEIVMDIAGELTDEVCAPLVMAVLNSDATDLFHKFTSLLYKAMKVRAEYRAIDMADQWEQNEDRDEAERRPEMMY